MSRALDPKLLDTLKSEDPTPIYNSLVEVLTSQPPSSSSPEQDNTQLWEIEILGKSHSLEPGTCYLQDGPALAIPKARLLQAFCIAHGIIRQYLDRRREHSRARLNYSSRAAEGNNAENDQVRVTAGEGKLSGGDVGMEETYSSINNASAIALLMDSEHMTAANIRKRNIQRQLKTLKAGDRGRRRTAKIILSREKCFIDSLLTARLYRHAKSPVLWSHRRWLMDLWACWVLPGPHNESEDTGKNHGKVGENSETGEDSEGSGQGSATIHRDIVRIVMVAAERHPRNYYGWDHARWLVQRFIILFLAPKPKNTKPGSTYPGDRGESQTIQELLDDVKSWCFRHHNDVSGWMFLEFLLNYLPLDSPVSPVEQLSSLHTISTADSTINQSPIMPTKEILLEVLNLTEKFRWANESVWYFLRVMIARRRLGNIPSEDQENIEDPVMAVFWRVSTELKGVDCADGGEELRCRVLRSAEVWVERVVSNDWGGWEEAGGKEAVISGLNTTIS